MRSMARADEEQAPAARREEAGSDSDDAEPQKPVNKNKRYRRDKPWDNENIDHWTVRAGWQCGHAGAPWPRSAPAVRCRRYLHAHAHALAGVRGNDLCVSRLASVLRHHLFCADREIRAGDNEGAAARYVHACVGGTRERVGGCCCAVVVCGVS